jgi:SRSO17 transposase
MDYEMGADAQRRLIGFFAQVGEALGNRKRRASFAAYAMGLLGEGERKSMEPMAMRVCDGVEHADAAHQRLQHFITDSPWDDREVRLVASRYALEAMTKREPALAWIIDDTGFLKQGTHSVGVQRQYTGTAGKITNCQLGVSLTFTTATEQLPIDFALYLPKSWTEDRARRREARIPDWVEFKTKIELAIEMLARAVDEGVPRGILLADAFYGDEPSFRRAARRLQLDYAVGVKSDNRVWRTDRAGHPRGEPLTVGELAQRLKRKAFKRVTWRQGTRRSLASRFAAMRVVPAYRSNDDPVEQREVVWLLVEWPRNEPEPTTFSFATLPHSTRLKQLVRITMERWRTERVYEDLKGELGLDHFEGRRFPGWNHHVSVALCCYAFIIAERVRLFPPSPAWTTDTEALRLSA